MSYVLVCFLPYLVIDARNRALAATFHPPAYVGNCHALAPVLVVLVRRKQTANIRWNNFPLVHIQGPKITYIADEFLVFVIFMASDFYLVN